MANELNPFTNMMNQMMNYFVGGKAAESTAYVENNLNNIFGVAKPKSMDQLIYGWPHGGSVMTPDHMLYGMVTDHLNVIDRYVNPNHTPGTINNPFGMLMAMFMENVTGRSTFPPTLPPPAQTVAPIQLPQPAVDPQTIAQPFTDMIDTLTADIFLLDLS